MSPSATATSPASFAAIGLDTTRGRPFVRDRLAFLGKSVCLIAFAFYLAVTAVNLGMGVMSARDHFLARQNLAHAGGVVTMLLLWQAARRGDWSRGTLGWLDAVAVVVCGLCWALMIDATDQSVMNALMAATVTVIARSAVVPSTPGRTFVLSLASMAAILPAVLLAPRRGALWDAGVPAEMAPMITGLNVALWIGASVAAATLTSRVIYGLRQQVKEATELGQYTLEEPIGSGGMGEVWRAHHRLLIRNAAIKLIRPEALGSAPGDPDLLLRRFEREARATASLQSPHTVQLYDFGVADDGTLYYVMELLQGFNLEDLVRKFGPLPAERVVYILGQVCCSLADAHHNGLVHRDIKPANIFVSRFGLAYDFVKVLDFGLVKLDLAKEGEEAVRLTGTGFTTGTPAYMAPEVVLGESSTDHRVDIYSLGCVAYWLLTGKLVFEAPTGMKMMLDHAHTAPPSPSTRVELPIPPELERLVLDCLEKDPSRRPASAIEIAHRLARCLPATKWTDDRAQRWWNLHAPALAKARPSAQMLMAQEAIVPARQVRQRD